MAGEKQNNFISFIIPFFLLFLAADIFIWGRVFFAKPANESRMYFLDVGQGDAELAVFPRNFKVLTDAGPDSKIVNELEKIPSIGDRYIDVAVISHPQLDHFNGFNYIIGRYRIGVFVYNGRSDSPGVEEWRSLINKIKEYDIPLVQLGAGDKITHLADKIDFLSPDADLLHSTDLNDTGLVELINSGGAKTLLTADISAETEKELAQKLSLRADVLKIPHHGSKFSSSDIFLAAVRPKVAIIEVGSKNRYGHPTADVLRRLSNISATIFRTDKNGEINTSAVDEKLKIFAEK